MGKAMNNYPPTTSADEAEKRGYDRGRAEIRQQLAGLSSCKWELVKAAQTIHQSVDFIQALLDVPMDKPEPVPLDWTGYGPRR